MKFKSLILLFIIAFLGSCKAYLDIGKTSIITDYMVFRYGEKQNTFDYFNTVNASVDRDIFYTTHFSITLPKKIIYWLRLDNNFFFEYDSKQIVYIYTSYKNEGKESDNWQLKNIDEGSELKCLEDYWKERGYNREWLLITKKKNRVTKVYTNGKYEILLYNIKERNFPSFLGFVKTFEINS